MVTAGTTIYALCTLRVLRGGPVPVPASKRSGALVWARRFTTSVTSRSQMLSAAFASFGVRGGRKAGSPWFDVAYPSGSRRTSARTPCCRIVIDLLHLQRLAEVCTRHRSSSAPDACARPGCQLRQSRLLRMPAMMGTMGTIARMPDPGAQGKCE